MAKHTHFGSFDGRFCGSSEQFRRMTTNPNKVTCPCCKARDTFTLSPDAMARVQEWERQYANS